MSTVQLQEELDYDEALQVLGFQRGAIVSPHLPAFRKVEKKLCELIETTSDEELKSGFREELGRLNEALRVVEADSGELEPPLRRKGMGMRVLVSLVLVACLVGIVWWGNHLVLKERGKKQTRNIERLAIDGRIAVENRRWPEAEEIYSTIERLDPGSTRARDGFRSIAEGKEAVRRQKIGFLIGSAQAAIEQRSWEDAEKTLAQVREMEPAHKEIPILFEKIEKGRTFDRIVKLLESAKKALAEEQWEELVTRTASLEELAPGHSELPHLKEMAARGMRLMEERRLKARELYTEALALDDGRTYSQAALDKLREAIRLSPQSDIQGLYEKMSRYTRLLEVPGQFTTISAALAAAKDNDKIRVGPGTYKEALVLPVAVDLEGAGPDKTVVVYEAEKGSVVLADRRADGSRLAGMLLRQEGIALTEERFPVVAINSARVNLEDCVVEGGSGHGVAVMAGGKGQLRNVRVRNSGWDGLAVYGSGSKAEVIDSRFERNLHHGIDAWEGGSVVVKKSRCTLNGFAGIVLMSKGVKSTLTQCTVDRNREVGILVSNGAHGELLANRAEANLLGGFLVEGEDTRVVLEGNIAEKNQEVGIVVDKRSTLESFKNNEARGNTGEQTKLQADLPQEVIKPPPILDIPSLAPEIKEPDGGEAE